MDSKEHQKLADVIKGVHEKLRKALYTSKDPTEVWNEHLRDYDLREKYSRAMLRLATEAWKGKECRIEWTYKTCMDHFFNGGLQRSLRRQWKLKNVSLQKKWNNLSLQEECDNFAQENNYKNLNRKLKLLDVGSCYNPFSKYEEFSCVAVDMTPATKDVLQTDFLEVDVQPKQESLFYEECSSQRIFFTESFDVVVLSLVLEYLPAAQQRAVFCYKSWQLLQENGLCIIITPDSKSVNHNVHMMKSWKLALEKIGFVRVKYDKLQHIHCMAFRKITTETASQADSIQWDSISKLLFIPQDLKKYSNEDEVLSRTEKETYDIYSNFLELPNEDVF